MNTTANRRDFLKQAATIGVCACCFGTLNFIEACTTQKNITAAVTETADMASFPVSAFGDKNFITLSTKKFAEPIFIGKQADGSYVALRMYCTHKGCGLKAAPDKLVCPCHGSEFSTQGAVLKGPARDPLQSFRVSVEGQTVIVHFA